MIGPALALIGIVGGAVAATTSTRRRVLVDRGSFGRGLNRNRVTRTGRVTPHWGIDIVAPVGTPVRAVSDGVVLLARPVRGYGNAVMVRHADGRQSSLYGHLNRSTVQEGQRVAAQQQVGEVGDSRSGFQVRWNGERFVNLTATPDAGNVSRPIDPHLHAEIHPTPVPQIGPQSPRLDPEIWLRDHGIEQYGERWRPTRRPSVA